MNWFAQLTRLIFDFYREDLPQLEQLQVLRRCRVSRRWGILRIDCRDRQTADAVAASAYLIREPVAQLRLAHQINIMVKGGLLMTVPVDPSKLMT